MLSLCRQTDEQMYKGKTICPWSFDTGGIKILSLKTAHSISNKFHMKFALVNLNEIPPKMFISWKTSLFFFRLTLLIRPRAPIHAFLEFLSPVLYTTFFQSHWLLCNIINETAKSGHRGMNPVTMTNTKLSMILAEPGNKQATMLKSSTLMNELSSLGINSKTGNFYPS